MKFYCDNNRHLVCQPYTEENLHLMAQSLGIGRHWFHKDANHSHYDIPNRRIAEIEAKCQVVSSKKILAIIFGVQENDIR